MPVTLSINNVPELIVQNIALRADQNHRTLQSELLTILEEAIKVKPSTPNQILAKVQQLGLETPAESVEMIRGDRDAR
jgi:plasmid stability protein